MDTKKKVWMQRRRRISEIIEAGTADDIVSRCYDIFSTLVTLTNVVVTVLYTFDKMELNHGGLLLFLEAATVAFLHLNILCVSGQPSLFIQICQNWGLSNDMQPLFPVLLTCCPSCRTICRSSFRRVLLCSGCSVWSGFSACSRSTRTMTP